MKKNGTHSLKISLTAIESGTLKEEDAFALNQPFASESSDQSSTPDSTLESKMETDQQSTTESQSNSSEQNSQ